MLSLPTYLPVRLSPDCIVFAWQKHLNNLSSCSERFHPLRARREAYDKLGTFAIYATSFILVIQALGLELGSVLAIGGLGGLAIGLAGREILENMLNGFLIMTTSPFEVRHAGGPLHCCSGLACDVVQLTHGTLTRCLPAYRPCLASPLGH